MLELDHPRHHNRRAAAGPRMLAARALALSMGFALVPAVALAQSQAARVETSGREAAAAAAARQDVDSAARKGFVLNIGIGPGYTTYSFGGLSGRQGKFTVATDLKIGYAFNDRSLLYYSNDASFFTTPTADLNVTGLSGFGFSHYLTPDVRSVYVDGSLGIATFSSLVDGDTERSSGFGLSAGAGLEFAPHWLLDADLIVGRPSTSFGTRMTTVTLRAGFHWLHY
jgi:hypothetical protein